MLGRITSKLASDDPANTPTAEPSTSRPSTTTTTTANSIRNKSTLPPLPFTLNNRPRQIRIAIFTVLLFVEAGLVPLILFYALKLGAHLSVTVNLAIITSLVGTFSGYKHSQRQWAMWFAKDGEEWRPIGAGRWGLDMSQ